MDSDNVFAIVAGVVLLGVVGGLTKSCVAENSANVEKNAADNRTAQACIASGRPSIDCAIIVKGTGK